MRNILAINAGSSSLKFQLLQMPEEHVTAKGQIDRIGLSESVFIMKFEQGRVEKNQDIQNHTEAVSMILEC